MTDKELAKAMRLIAECERRSGTAQPKTIDLLEQGAARLDALRWRSVEEGLPPIGDWVMACDGRGLVYSDIFWDGEAWLDGHDLREIACVTHWCPFPSPPSGYVTAPGEGER